MSNCKLGCSLLLKLRSDYAVEEQSTRDHYIGPCSFSNSRILYIHVTAHTYTCGVYICIGACYVHVQM